MALVNVFILSDSAFHLTDDEIARAVAAGWADRLRGKLDEEFEAHLGSDFADAPARGSWAVRSDAALPPSLLGETFRGR